MEEKSFTAHRGHDDLGVRVFCNAVSIRAVGSPGGQCLPKGEIFAGRDEISRWKCSSESVSKRFEGRFTVSKHTANEQKRCAAAMVNVRELPLVDEQRALGVWPRSALSPAENASVLDQLLSIEHKLAVLIHEDPLMEQGGMVERALPELLEESDCFVKSIDDKNWEYSLAATNLAFKMVLHRRFEEALVLLQSVKAFPPDRFGKTLVYKKHYVLFTLYNGLGDVARVKSSLVDGINALASVPTASELETNRWLKLIYDAFYDNFTYASVGDVDKLLKHKNFVISYFNYQSSRGLLTEENAKELRLYIVQRAESLIASTSFPKANEVNNHELEELIDLASLSSVLSPSRVKSLVEQAIAKTYQSHILMRAYIRALVAEKSYGELKSVLEVYEAYVHAFYEQNKHKYLDIVSIIQIQKLVLDYGLKHRVPLNFEDYRYFSDRVAKLEELLKEFYTIAGLDKFSQFDVAESLTTPNNVVVDESLGKILAGVWNTLGNATWTLINDEEYIYSENSSTVKALEHFKHSIWLHTEYEAVFNYAKTTAILGNIKESFKIVKTLLQNVSKTSSIYFQSCHLLALILSIEENKDEAYKVIGFLSSEVAEFIETSPIPLQLRDVFLQIKMTQLAIIQSLLGPEQALDSLPELFALFHKLYSDFIVSNVANGDAPSPEKSHKHSLSLARTQTLQTIQKIKTIGRKDHKEKTAQQQITIDPLAVAIKQKLQQVWLLAANIYYQLNLPVEAEEAIVESEKCYRPTSDSHVALALLTLDKRPELSFKEFDNALLLEKLSIPAVVGYAQLVLTAKESVFISERDQLAAISRAKILLETASETFAGAHTSEVWWLLSLIYERFNDNRLKGSLWKCVELEEIRPVRSFTVV